MTELIWDGKYDKATGKKCAPPRIVLPFQTVETVNESAADRHRTLDIFASGKPAEWRNRLIWGDKRYILPSLLPEFAGKVNLIYIDPPFDTGANFSYLATIPDAPPEATGSHRKPPEATGSHRKPVKTKVSPNGDEDEDDSEASSAIGGASGLSFVKEPSVIEQKAYRDTWGKGLDSYLKWFYETVVLLRELLTDDGSIYVHIGPNVSQYARVVLDEVFGQDNYITEIIWKRTTAHFTARRFAFVHDVIYQFTKSTKFIHNKPEIEHPEAYMDVKYKYEDEKGKYRLSDASGAGQGPPRSFFGRTISPPRGRHWASQEYIDENSSEYVLGEDGMPQKKSYLKTATVGSVWDDISPVNSQAEERNAYPTQKPEALLERIIKASSNPGDLVLDCFCGSGTTAAVAEKLGRRWITCDLGRFAIHTARKRFLAIDNVKPFVVQNLGKYERQQWQQAEFGDNAAALTGAYREFILSLYAAQPIQGYLWLHGVKHGHMVHVGGVDAPVSVGDVAQIVAEFKRSRGMGGDAPTQNRVDILGWDFAFELNEVSKQQAALAGVEVKFVRIPREVLEKKAVEQGDIKFFELAALSVDVQTSGKGVILTLRGFVIPLDDVPHEIQAAITHWEQWIDYWAVDWDNKGDTFHNQWQSYRTRKDKTIQKVIASPPGTYPQPGEYRVVVKVIDILGNDTTKTLKVQVK